MRYTTVVSTVDFIGYIWMPNTLCAQSVTLSSHDLENVGEWTRENVERWLMLHSGDFQEVVDFRAEGAKDWESDWKDEESELTFNDCMYSTYD